jgi:hypothetical protein
LVLVAAFNGAVLVEMVLLQVFQALVQQVVVVVEIRLAVFHIPEQLEPMVVLVVALHILLLHQQVAEHRARGMLVGKAVVQINHHGLAVAEVLDQQVAYNLLEVEEVLRLQVHP